MQKIALEIEGDKNKLRDDVGLLYLIIKTGQLIVRVRNIFLLTTMLLGIGVRFLKV